MGSIRHYFWNYVIPHFYDCNSMELVNKMVLDSIWDGKGEWLTKESKTFRARSSGCSCCSMELTTEKEVRKETISSLHWVLRASRHFKWDIQKLLEEGNEMMIKEEAKQ